jgi:hypothetical protein
MAGGRKLNVCAEQDTLEINRDHDRLKLRAAKNRAVVPGDNMYKDGQTSPQALATVADDERVGRIDHQSLDTVQRSQLVDIPQVSTLIVFLARPIPQALCTGTYVDDWSHDEDKANARPLQATRCYNV